MRKCSICISSVSSVSGPISLGEIGPWYVVAGRARLRASRPRQEAAACACEAALSLFSRCSAGLSAGSARVRGRSGGESASCPWLRPAAAPGHPSGPSAVIAHAVWLLGSVLCPGLG